MHIQHPTSIRHPGMQKRPYAGPVLLDYGEANKERQHDPRTVGNVAHDFLTAGNLSMGWNKTISPVRDRKWHRKYRKIHIPPDGEAVQ